MATAAALRCVADIESFMIEYYSAWGGTDEGRIMSYYADNVTVQIPGNLMQGKSAVRDVFVRPFITAFPGNRHFIKNMTFGREMVVVEFTFEAEHKGPFVGRAATDACVKLPGCGVYEYDSAKRQITAARIHFDMGTLLEQLIDSTYSNLRAEEAVYTPDDIAQVKHLDLATAIQISQALSREIVVENLVDRFMRAAIEHAGAERALLVAVRGEELRTSAEAAAHGDEVTVEVRQHPVPDAVALPDSLIRYSIRTRDPVVLDDAMAENPFSADPYIVTHHVRSALCLPLINQGKLIGILYLENNLTPHVFTPDRVMGLKMLASQAAISLENSRL